MPASRSTNRFTVLFRPITYMYLSGVGYLVRHPLYGADSGPVVVVCRESLTYSVVGNVCATPPARW